MQANAVGRTMFKCTCRGLGQNWSTPRQVYQFSFGPPWDQPGSLIYGLSQFNADAKGLLGFGQFNRQPCGATISQKPSGPFYNEKLGLCNVTAFNNAPTPYGMVYSTPWWGVDYAMRSTE